MTSPFFGMQRELAPAGPGSSAPQPGLLAKIFGGADPSQSGLLDVLQMKRLGGSALTEAGLAMLEASGRGQGIGSVLASGVRGGRQGYQAGAATLQQNQQGARQQQLLQMRQAVMQKYAGKTDLESMQGMLSELIAMGDIEAAKPLAGYLNAAVNAQAGGQQFHRPIEIKTKDAAGKPVTALIDPVTREKLAEYPSVDTRNALEELTRYQIESLTRMDRRDKATRRAQIYDDFRADTRSHAAAAQGFSVIHAAMKDPKNSASPIALLYAYGKLLDPGSVVREGELATLQKIGSLDQRIGQALQQAATGTMSPEIRQYIYQQAQSIAQSWAEGFDDYVNTARVRAQDAEIEDIDKRLTNPFHRFGFGQKKNPLLDGE